MKRPIWKIWWVWLIAIILLFNSCGCFLGACAAITGTNSEEAEIIQAEEQSIEGTEPSQLSYETAINDIIEEKSLDNTTFNIIVSSIPDYENIILIEPDGTHSYKIYTEDGKIYLMAMFMSGENENKVARISTNERIYSERTILYEYKNELQDDESLNKPETIEKQNNSQEENITPAETKTPAVQKENAEVEEEDNYVYTTSSGSKYHTYSCRYVKNSRKEITLEQAQKRGLSPCKVCKP